MKAAPFDYAKPGTLAEALSLKSAGGGDARFLAGGQSLLPAMNMRVDRPALLIDLNGLTELDGIAEDGDGLVIGALTRTRSVGASPLVAARAPLLARCLEHIAHPAVRTLGTFGGSVALADPAGEWPAACLALDAVMVAAGPDGEREIPATRFFEGDYETALAENEMLARVRIPGAPAGARACVQELARRRGDFAIAGVMAQAVPGADGTLTQPRVAFFGISDRPVRLPEVERALAEGGRDGVEAAREALAAGCTFTGDLYHAPATKRHLAGVLLGRAVAAISDDQGEA